MPRATVKNEETEKIDLTTLSGGYVVLRKLNYGEYLRRRDLAMEFQANQGKGKKGEASMQLTQRRVAEFEFSRAVVDHNLEDEAGEKLNFADPKMLDTLDPRIGDEIGTHIDRMNSFEADLGNE